MEYEVKYLVIGAGLAGSAFGLRMLRSREDVILIDSASATGKEKLCGGLLGKTAVDELKVLFSGHVAERIGLIRPEGFRGYTSMGEYCGDPPFEVAERKKIDDLCINEYIAAGGRLLDRVSLVSLDRNERIAVCFNLRKREMIRFRYGMIIGADGAASSMRRLAAGRLQRVIPSIQRKAEKICQDIIFESTEDAAGYLWYIPNRTNAVAGCAYRGLSKTEMKDRLSKFCMRLGCQVQEMRGAFIPSGDDILLRRGDNEYFIGDAAGLAESFSGGGIHYALISAGRLASCLCDGMDYEDSLKNIVREMHSDHDRCMQSYGERLKKLKIFCDDRCAAQ